MINIALSTDENYAPHCLTTICSICENSNDELTFYIIYNKLEEKTIKIFSNFIKKYKNVNLFFIPLNFELLKELPFGRNDMPNVYVSLATYNRLFLAQIIPEDVKKIIYLDCDIIVKKSLKQMFETNIDNYAIAAVPDSLTYNLSTYARLQYSPDLGYFNAGVLLINLDYWRKHKVFSDFMNFIKHYPERISCHDQDVMNYVLRNSKLNLPFEFNLQEEFIKVDTTMIATDWKKLKEAASSPAIVHYSSRRKPWYKECNHPYKDDYLKYKSKTEYASLPLQHIRLNKKEKVKKVLSFFHLCNKPSPLTPRKYNTAFISK